MPIPTSLFPVYFTLESNDPVRLYEGPLEVEQNNVKVLVTGYIELVWMRNPAIEITFRNISANSTNNLDRFDLGRALLHLPGSSTPIKIYILRIGNLFGEDGHGIKYSAHGRESIL